MKINLKKYAYDQKVFEVEQEIESQVKSFLWMDLSREKPRLFHTVEIEQENGFFQVITDQVFQVVN